MSADSLTLTRQLASSAHLRAPNAHDCSRVNGGMAVPPASVDRVFDRQVGDDGPAGSSSRVVDVARALGELATRLGPGEGWGFSGAPDGRATGPETGAERQGAGVRGEPPEAVADRGLTIGKQGFPPPLNSPDDRDHASRHDRRRERYTLRRAARGIYATEQAADLRGALGRLPRWARCGWTAAGGSVEVHATGEGHERRAWWGGLVTCGSVWACPACSAKILAKRTDEAVKVDAWARENGARAYLVTFTISHAAHHDLSTLLRGLSRSWQAMQSGAPWQRFKQDREILGYVRRLEITRGSRAGWHPHLHVIVWAKRDLQGELPWLNARWSAMVGRKMDGARGAFELCTPSNEARADGVRLRRRRCAKLELERGARSSVRATTGGKCSPIGPGWSRSSSSVCAVGARVARPHRPKHGQGVQIESLRTDMGVKYAVKAVLEATSSDSKTETRGAAWTMAKLLRRACDLEPWGGERHSARARRAWLEYVRATRGRRLLGWSTGLRAAAGLEPDKPDKALADEEPKPSTLVARVPLGAWVRLRPYPRAVVGVLEATEARRWGDVVAAGGELELEREP